MKKGDKVVCINDSFLEHTASELSKDVPNWIKRDKEYTIREIVDFDFVVGVYLEEVVNPPKYFKIVNQFLEPTFRIDRFRKIETIKETRYEEVQNSVGV